MTRACQHCGRPGVRRLYCSSACKKRAFRRRRRRGLPEHAYPAGANRGRVPLDELTKKERAAAIATAWESTVQSCGRAAA